MRTIKFRGRDFAGFWYIGDLVQNNAEDDDLLISRGCVSIYIENETVGQFTGLVDKNGKEIYEGDIIIEKLRRARKDGERLVICFDDFEWQGKNANGSTTSLSLLVEYHTIEVIGNIHDNPELLKGE